MNLTIDKSVDARDSYCPGPLMELIRMMKSEPVGTVIEVLSSDQGSAKDIPEWIHKVGQEYLGAEEKDGFWSIVVKKVK
ncbi:MAG: sulfurtransferase TusA family protein [Deltaproteobacteria bacterium]|nr:sulfurtransferase TusA family protein [Deltaproteobacteria bacterium]